MCSIEALLTKQGIIRGIEIHEDHEYSDRVESFTVQVKTDGKWKDVATGKKLGKFRKTFDPINATAVRLDITAASDGPTISEIRVIR